MAENKRKRNYQPKSANAYEMVSEPIIRTTVQIEIPNLNIRKGPGYEFEITGLYVDQGTSIITEIQNGWGKLNNGSGWINLDYVTINR